MEGSDFYKDVFVVTNNILNRIKERYYLEISEKDRTEITFEIYKRICLMNLDCVSKDGYQEYKIGNLYVSDMIRDKTIQTKIEHLKKEIIVKDIEIQELKRHLKEILPYIKNTYKNYNELLQNIGNQ
jgi:hypothetical protein